MKRAAVKFGIARELYKREFDENDEQPVNPTAASVDRIAKNLGDMVTARQLVMIKGIAREMSINPDEECNKLMHCSVDELNKRAASDFIDHLKELQLNAMPMRRVG